MTLPHLPITRKEFDDLLEYSHTLPTGTTPGKRWKAQTQDNSWVIGEFGARNEIAGTIEIRWYAPAIFDNLCDTCRKPLIPAFIIYRDGKAFCSYGCRNTELMGRSEDPSTTPSSPSPSPNAGHPWTPEED